MFLLIGTDEAGYGPNLGPLVVSASVWRIDGSPKEQRLYERVSAVVCRESAEAHSQRVAWADSKALYSPGQGLSVLERGVLAALELVDLRPTDWRGLWRSLDASSAERLDALPWHLDFNLPLPLAAEPANCDGLVPALRDGLAAGGAHLMTLRSRAVFPEQFNGLADQHGNKAELLSRLTLELVAELLAEFAPNCHVEKGDRHLAATSNARSDEPVARSQSPFSAPLPVRIICDKHGGRSRYAALLQRQFDDSFIEVRREDATESHYAWGSAQARTEIRFRMQGEDFLPVALASMASKYLREAAMLAFNQFWCARVKELRPTAGYPTDARRFKQQIEPLQRALGVKDCVLWRTR